MADEVATVVDTPRRAREEAPPSRLGHFQLLAPIGEGGMGAVYSAYDMRLDRKVAIKLLHAGEHDDRLNQRLLREAQAMAKLSHPNVVPIYEVGIENQTVFIAMEYVEGTTLHKWLATKPPLRAILDVFSQAGRGLAAAHEAGIVHRDFKPGNVLVDARGRVYVTDFGVAQVGANVERSGEYRPSDLDSSGELTPPTEPLTEAGVLVGTPAYMSPEQFRGGAVDARSDQFAFCITLWEALYGKRPFKGHGKDLRLAVSTAKLEKTVNAKVPGWLYAILVRGLSPEPADRFASMSELVDALSRDPARRRKQLAVGGLGLAIVAGLAALVGWGARGGDEPCSGAEARLAGIWDDTTRAALERTFLATKLPYAPTTAKRVASVLDGYRASWITMRVDACRATKVRGEQSEHVLDLRMACLDQRAGELQALTSVLATEVDPKLVAKAVDAASSLTPVVRCADTTVLLGPAVHSDPKLRAELDALNTQRRLGRYRETLAPAEALANKVRGGSDARLESEVLLLLGILQTKTGHLEAAERSLGEALRHARRTGDGDLFIDITAELLSTLGEGGISKSRDAVGLARVAHVMFPDAHDPGAPVRLLVEEAADQLVVAHNAEALPLLHEAVERTRKAFGPDHAMMLRVQSGLAHALTSNSKHAEALAEYEALVAADTRTLGALHPNTINARLEQCQAFGAAGQRERAVACFEQVLPDADRIVGPRQRQVLNARNAYALWLMGLKRFDDAHRVLMQALADVPEDAWADRWYGAIDILRNLGETELMANDYAAALEHCTKARELTGDPQHGGGMFEPCIEKANKGLRR